MPDFDVFNGDADGICALHQLRLAEPRGAERITGVKRDIRLLERIVGRTGPSDRVTVLDIAVEPNQAPLATILASGARVQWFDHHFPGELPVTPALDARIDLSPEVCTSLLVDRHLGGRYRAWAIAAAFGDGLSSVATRVAENAGYDSTATRQLAELGEAINYNAYGESTADLFMAPEELYERISAFEDPRDFARVDPVAGELVALMATDLGHAMAVDPVMHTATCIAYRLPDERWARRISGHFANVVAERHPQLAVAVLATARAGDLVVSVRAPKDRPVGADVLCRRFPTGGGRSGAGGVNALPATAVGQFLHAFAQHFTAPDHPALH